MAAEDAAVVVTLRANLKDYESALKSAVRSTERAAKAAETAVSGIGRKAQAAPIASAFQKSAGQIANDARVMQFQLNDIFSGLASGQGIRAVQQQLSQIDQLLAGGSMAQGARTLGTALMGMVSPVSLAVVAFGVLSTVAASYFGDTEDDAEKVNKELEKHVKLLQDIKSRWAEALPGVGKYIDEITRLAQAQQKLADRQALVADAFKDVVAVAGDVGDKVVELQGILEEAGATDQAKALRDAFEAWNKEVQAGHSGAVEFVKMQEAIAAALQTGVGGVEELARGIETNLVPVLRKTTEQVKEIQKAFDELRPPAALSGIGPPSPGLGLEAGQAATERLNKSLDGAADAIDSFVERVIQAESAGAAGAKNPLSSATGAGQFISSTWLSVFKQHFADEAAGMSDAAILALRTDIEWNRRLIRAYATDNAKLLIDAGQEVNEAALQLAHFLGAGGAIKVLKAAPGTPVSQILPANVIAANRPILGGGATREDVLAYAQRRTRAPTRQKEANTDLEDWLKLSKEDLELKNKQLDINAQFWESEALRKAQMEEQKLIQEGLTAATKEYGTVTDEMRAKIEAAAHAQAFASVASEEAAEKQKQFADRQKQNAQAMADFAQQMNQMAQSALGGLINDLRNGVSAGDAFNNMLNRILDSLIQIGLQSLFSQKGLGGIISSFLTGVPAAHSGGSVSHLAGGRPRQASPLLWAGAPRYASGGVVGLGPGEVPIIAHRGEIIVPNAKRLASSGAGKVDNSVHNDLGPVSINMAGSGMVAAGPEQAKQFGENIRKIIAVEMVRESRPGGLLRKVPG
jgi:hypothetical protein